jgi:hypothetical protein
MPADQRPGGLTALAVLNIVFAGFGTLGVIAMSAVLVLVHAGVITNCRISVNGLDANQCPLAVLFGGAAVAMVANAMLLISGIGMLRQRRVMGRVLGNVCAAFMLLAWAMWTAYVIIWCDSFSLDLTWLIYPAVLLSLINTRFRDHLVN